MVAEVCNALYVQHLQTGQHNNYLETYPRPWSNFLGRGTFYVNPIWSQVLNPHILPGTDPTPVFAHS